MAKKTIAQLEEEVKSLQAENAQLKSDSGVGEKIQTLEAENAELIEKVKTLENENSELKSINADLSKDNAKSVSDSIEIDGEQYLPIAKSFYLRTESGVVKCTINELKADKSLASLALGVGMLSKI